MKKSLLLASLILLTLPLFAQKDTIPCSTIILGNDKEISATIIKIESGNLFYERCPDTTDRQFTIPVNYIKEIIEPSGKIDSLSSHVVKTEKTQSFKIKNKPIKKWVFKKIGKKITRTISKGLMVKVTFLDENNKQQKVSGRWKNLTEEAVILETKKGTVLTIPKKDVIQIKLLRKLRALGTSVWFILLIGGVALLTVLGIVVAWNFFINYAGGTASVNPNNAAKDYGCGLGCTLPILLVAGAFVVMLLIMPKSIREPFSGKWEITYPSAQKDQQETIKLP